MHADCSHFYIRMIDWLLLFGHIEWKVHTTKRHSYAPHKFGPATRKKKWTILFACISRLRQNCSEKEWKSQPKRPLLWHTSDEFCDTYNLLRSYGALCTSSGAVFCRGERASLRSGWRFVLCSQRHGQSVLFMSHSVFSVHAVLTFSVRKCLRLILQIVFGWLCMRVGYAYD